MKFQEELVHKQYHLKGHPTFTYRKGKTYYYRRKIPQDLADLYTKPLFVGSTQLTGDGIHLHSIDNTVPPAVGQYP